MSRKYLLGLLVVVFALLTSATAFAQDATPEATGEAGPPPMGELPPPPEGAEVVAEGLLSPRLLSIGPDGTIYIAEAGMAGEETVEIPDMDPVPMGPTSQVTAVSPDGEQSVLISGLLSATAEAAGATDVLVTEDAIYVLMGGAGPFVPAPAPLGQLLIYDPETLEQTGMADYGAFEVENNPDGNELDSNANDIELGPDGTIYIVETGANAIYTWDAETGFTVFHVWPDNPVPTAVDFDAEGNLYVSFLGAEIAPGAGQVQKLSPEGEVLETWGGYNGLTDIAVADDGTIYVSSIFSGFGPQGPMPGQILRVTPEGGEVVVDGLLFPYGIDFDADGNMLVTTGTTFLPPGSGMLLRFPAPEGGM